MNSPSYSVALHRNSKKLSANGVLGTSFRAFKFLLKFLMEKPTKTEMYKVEQKIIGLHYMKRGYFAVNFIFAVLCLMVLVFYEIELFHVKQC